MIKFNTKRWGEVQVRFEYDYPYRTYASMTFKDGEDHVVVDTAMVSLFKGDIWNKREGRKQAFTKLLGVVGLDREDRTAAWESFFTTCKL